MTMMYKRDQDMEVKMINENVSKHASAGAGKIDIKHKRRDGSRVVQRYCGGHNLLLLDGVVMENREGFVDLAVHRIVVL
jgi:hypothetical protein